MRIITKQNYTVQANLPGRKRRRNVRKSLIQKFSYLKHSPLDEMEDCQTRTGAFLKSVPECYRRVAFSNNTRFKILNAVILSQNTVH